MNPHMQIHDRVVSIDNFFQQHWPILDLSPHVDQPLIPKLKFPLPLNELLEVFDRLIAALTLEDPALASAHHDRNLEHVVVGRCRLLWLFSAIHALWR